MSATITNLYLLEVDGRSIGQFTRAQLISIRAEVNKILTPNCDGNTDRIITAVCHHFRITQKAILGPNREQRVCWPRHVAMHLIRERTDLPFCEIAGIFKGHKKACHKTAIHALGVVSDRTATEPEARAAIDAIRALIDSQQNGDPKATP